MSLNTVIGPKYDSSIFETSKTIHFIRSGCWRSSSRFAVPCRLLQHFGQTCASPRRFLSLRCAADCHNILDKRARILASFCRLGAGLQRASMNAMDFRGNLGSSAGKYGASARSVTQIRFRTIGSGTQRSRMLAGSV